MSKVSKIKGTAEAWESGELGTDESFARVSETVSSDDLDELLGLTEITLRVDEELVQVLNAIAEVHGVEYETLLRHQLQRFASSEAKRLVTQNTGVLKDEHASAESDADGFDPDAPPRKQA